MKKLFNLSKDQEWNIRYGHKNSLKLFSILYKNAQNGLFLERKYKRFLEGFKKGEA